jgi:hypothetical protein
MRVGTKLVQGVLGLVFLGAGLQKLAGSDTMVDDFARYRYPQWFRVATGAVEVAGAAGMLAGLSRSALAPVGGVLLGATMVGAIATHARLGDPGKVVVPPGRAARAGGRRDRGERPARRQPIRPGRMTRAARSTPFAGRAGGPLTVRWLPAPATPGRSSRRGVGGRRPRTGAPAWGDPGGGQTTAPGGGRGGQRGRFATREDARWHCG